MKWKDSFGCFSDLMNDIVTVSLGHENVSLEESVDIVFKSRSLCFERQLYDAFWKLIPVANDYVRACRRQECLKTLTDADLEVFVVGKSWPAIYGDRLKVGAEIDVREMIALMRRAKVVLNVNPSLQDSHERVFYAMLNGSVCVTDKTDYLAEEFTDGEDLTFFTWKDINRLPDKVHSILQSSDQWLAMAAAGQRKATERHTWLARAQRILELVSYFKTLKALGQ